ncbi:hypothetical protein [Streptomyces uncialis]|uniref:hypothetical protein n=1 Tax=Streptomyces uncialis TaxID=1048205 RepID=UPI0033C84D5B
MTGSGAAVAAELDGRDVLTAMDGAGVDDSPLGVQHRGRRGFGRFGAVPSPAAVGHLGGRRSGTVVLGLIPAPGLVLVVILRSGLEPVLILVLVLVRRDHLVRLVRFRFSHVVLSERSVRRESSWAASRTT